MEKTQQKYSFITVSIDSALWPFLKSQKDYMLWCTLFYQEYISDLPSWWSLWAEGNLTENVHALAEINTAVLI